MSERPLGPARRPRSWGRGVVGSWGRGGGRGDGGCPAYRGVWSREALAGRPLPRAPAQASGRPDLAPRVRAVGRLGGSGPHAERSVRGPRRVIYPRKARLRSEPSAHPTTPEPLVTASPSGALWSSWGPPRHRVPGLSRVVVTSCWTTRSAPAVTFALPRGPADPDRQVR